MSFGCYHRLCRAIRQSYKFISLIYKTPIVGALGRGSRTLLIVEKEVMAPRTVGGLTRGMAHDGHICHENYEFISAGGPAPEFAFRRALDLHFGDLDPVVYGGCTQGGQYPLSPSAMAKSSTQGARGPWLKADSPREWP
jgi:hypothetical protein